MCVKNRVVKITACCKASDKMHLKVINYFSWYELKDAEIYCYAVRILLISFL